jgi:hypothetical protein
MKTNPLTFSFFSFIGIRLGVMARGDQGLQHLVGTCDRILVKYESWKTNGRVYHEGMRYKMVI